MPDSICLSHTVVAKLMSEHRCSRAGGKRPESCGGFGRGGDLMLGHGLGKRSGWREEAGFGAELSVVGDRGNLRQPFPLLLVSPRQERRACRELRPGGWSTFQK